MSGTAILHLPRTKRYAKVQHNSELDTAFALNYLPSNKEKTNGYDKRWTAARALRGGKKVQEMFQRGRAQQPL